jgi:hypothetical protein
VLFETFAGLSLYKELSDTFRPQGICIQPVMSQYVVSVPSQPLGEIQIMREAVEAWSSATVAVVSHSQHEILKEFSSNKGPHLILLDCRFSTIEGLHSENFANHGLGRNIVCLLTPMQICLLDTSFDMHAIAIPIMSERSTWDPHLKPLYLEAIINIEQGCPRNLLQIRSEAAALDSSSVCIGKETIFSYDLIGAANEAICEISNLIQELG